MTQEEFNRLNPVIVGNEHLYNSKKEAYLAQGKFLKNRTFIFDTLQDRIADVLKCRFGVYTGRMWTLQEVADKYDLTRERVRQLERNGIIELQHPHRVRLLMRYNDTNFDRRVLKTFSASVQSLIRKDIVYKISDKLLELADTISIDELDINMSKTGQKEDFIKQTLYDANINTCKDLIIYLREKGTVKELGLSDGSCKALILSICELFDAEQANKDTQDILDSYKDRKRQIAWQKRTEIQMQKLKEKLAEKDIKFDEKLQEKILAENRMKSIFEQFPNVPIEQLNFSYSSFNTLKRSGIDTLHDLIHVYFENGQDLKSLHCLGPKKEQDIIEKLIQYNLDLEIAGIEQTTQK